MAFNRIRSMIDAALRHEELLDKAKQIDLYIADSDYWRKEAATYLETVCAVSSRNAVLEEDVSYRADILAKGKLFEFDYSYRPQHRHWGHLPTGRLLETTIDSRREVYRSWLASFCEYSSYFKKVATTEDQENIIPSWNNGWFPPLDAICLYGLLAKKNPNLYVEVGSGNSTKFARMAIADHGLRTKIISIDPFPRANIDQLCDEVVRSACEDVDISLFSKLDAGDILFIDNSHRSFQGSDVTIFFTEILPALKSGVIWGVHDIFLPFDYPDAWRERMYSEQYLLIAYLLGGGGGDQIELPVNYLSHQPNLIRELIESFDGPPPWGETKFTGGAFWMTKK